MIFLMDLPKPIHGMSTVNLAVSKIVTDDGLKAKIINTVPSYAAGLFPGKLWACVKVLHTLICFIKLLYTLIFSRAIALYRPINGGSGQVFDLMYIAISRVFIKKLYIHHHSFSYLNNTSSLFAFLNKIAGNNTSHVVLGESMARLLTEKYGIDAKRIRIVSNLAFFEADSEPEKTLDPKIRIGHLANLCSEKGVDLFVEICNHLKNLDLDFGAQIAGPFVDQETEKFVLQSIKINPQIEYIGPVYADQKRLFYKNLDCFVFPSKYTNEAEPLVLYEAAMQGVYLAGTRRGCMQDVITSLNGYSVNESDDVALLIARNIHLQQSTNGFSVNNRSKRLDLFKQQRIKAKSALTSLITEMSHNE